MDRVKAVFDGKVLVLQEPVDWPEGTEVEVSLREPGTEEIERMTPDEAWEWLVSHPRNLGGEDFDRGDLYP